MTKSLEGIIKSLNNHALHLVLGVNLFFNTAYASLTNQDTKNNEPYVIAIKQITPDFNPDDQKCNEDDIYALGIGGIIFEMINDELKSFTESYQRNPDENQDDGKRLFCSEVMKFVREEPKLYSSRKLVYTDIDMGSGEDPNAIHQYFKEHPDSGPLPTIKINGKAYKISPEENALGGRLISLKGKAINPDNLPKEGFEKDAAKFLSENPDGIYMQAAKGHPNYPNDKSGTFYLFAKRATEIGKCSACHEGPVAGALVVPIYSPE